MRVVHVALEDLEDLRDSIREKKYALALKIANVLLKEAK
jgi:hypothetical protein